MARIELTRRHVEFAVTDKGPGLSTDVIDRVFDPYVTTKEHGTGLGLAIVKKLVLEHQGLITVARVPEGSQFTFTLPLADDQSEQL